jgi:type IV pilus assembly protein PilF
MGEFGHNRAMTENILTRLLRFALLLGLVAFAAACQTNANGPNSAGTASESNPAIIPGPTSVIPQSTEESDERRRARIRLELAAGYYQQGNYNVALEELRVALQLDPAYPAAFGILGLIYMDLGDKPKADESFQRALRLAPRDADLNNNYGWYLCQTGRPKESIRFFNQALEDRLYTTPAKPLHNAGICSLRAQDLTSAEAYFRRAFQVEPGNAVTNYQLALLNLNRDQFDQARFYAKRLLDNFDANSQTLYLAVCVETKAGNATGAASLAQQLRRKFSASPEATMLQNNDCNLTP